MCLKNAKKKDNDQAGARSQDLLGTMLTMLTRCDNQLHHPTMFLSCDQFSLFNHIRQFSKNEYCVWIVGKRGKIKREGDEYQEKGGLAVCA
jgi:hypothetical protein